MNKYENKERKDSNPFSMRISIFLGVIFLCVLVITMVTALKELKNIKAVNVLVTEIYDASLPRLIDDQKLLVNIENLRRYAEIAYVSDNAEKRREARINARELISETTAITSDELYADSLLAARAIDGLVRIRNQRDQQEAELMLALSDYLGAMTIFSHYMDTGTFNNTIYNYFLANYMVPSNDLLKKSPEEFQKDLESHVELLRETHIYVRPHLSPPERKTFDDSLAALDLSLTRIDVAVTSIRDLMREMDEQWNEIDLLMKSLRDRVRMGTESSVRNILSIIIDNTNNTLRASYILFGVLVLVIILGFILIHLAVTNPLRSTTEKLDSLRDGRMTKERRVIRILEIKRLAELLDMFSEHLSGLYIQTNYLEGEAARKKDLEQLMQAVFNASLDGYVVWNKKNVEFVSPKILSLLDVGSEEVFSSSYERFGFSASHMREMYYKAVDSGSEREESTLVTSNRSFIPVELTYIPVDYHKSSCLLTYIRDLRVSKMTETELRLAKDKAEVATQAKSNFLAAMSHELKSPMNGILGLTRLLLGTELNKFQRDYLYSVEESARALLGIIDNILDYSQLESGRLLLDGNEFSLDKVLNDVVEFNQAQSTLRGIPIVINLDPKRASVYQGDSGKLHQVLNNLLGNALKFTEKGFISINVTEECLAANAYYVDGFVSNTKTDTPGEDAAKTEKTITEFKPSIKDPPRDGNMVVLHFSVRDTGVGLTPEARRNLFNAFSMGDVAANRKYGGTGMGLALSKSLVKMMGGKIWCESDLGVGSTFHFTAVVTPKDDKNLEEKIA